MKRTIAIKLTLSEAECGVLVALQKTFSAACNSAAKVAFQEKQTNRVRLHNLAYRQLREQFPELKSQMCCNAIAKAAQALKACKGRREVVFREQTSVHFDKRTYSLKDQVLSLFTMQGRIQLQLNISPYHTEYLKQGKIKEAELVRKGNRWFFHLVLDLPDVALATDGKILAVDFGENNLAATSTGKILGGGPLRAKRNQFLGHRRRLQSNGSRSSKQRLRQISGRERRHVTHVNHCVSKAIILEAKQNGCTRIVLEDLKNIRSRIKANKRMRSRLHAWAFNQLRHFVSYKAESEGIEVTFVNPAYTSVTCSCCLCEGKRVKHRFTCSNCGSRQHSDLNASQNLLRLASTAVEATGAVNHRHVAA